MVAACVVDAECVASNQPHCVLFSLVVIAMTKRRENMAERSSESWRPPPCAHLGPLRRFFDLQAGSIQHDIAPLLACVKGTLLDASCGAQPHRALVPPQVRYLAIDSADAHEHFGFYAPDAVYYSGRCWPIEDRAIDTVLCTEALEHVLDPLTFLKEAWRCLSAGGQLILTVPFAARWHFIPRDYWRFTPSSLGYLLEAAGFEGVEVYARGNSLTVACYKNMAIVASLLMPQGPRSWKAVAGRALGALLSPFFVACALLGNASLSRQGDDCLGYTVLARKPLADASRPLRETRPG